MSNPKERVYPPPMSLRDLTVEDNGNLVRVWLDRISWKPFEENSRKEFCDWIDNFNKRQLQRKDKFRLFIVTAQLRGGDDMLPLVARVDGHRGMGVGEIMEASFQTLQDELDPPDIKKLRSRVNDAMFNHGIADIMGVKEDS